MHQSQISYKHKKTTNMKQISIYLSAFLILTFGSCRKHDRVDWNASITPTVANLAGYYKLTSARWNNLDVFSNSNWSLNLFHDCDKDDIYKFNDDMSYQVVDLGKTCSPSNNETGTWNLVNTSTLRINDENTVIEYFNGKQLIIKQNARGQKLKMTFEKF
jgi:hypothetical protein